MPRFVFPSLAFIAVIGHLAASEPPPLLKRPLVGGADEVVAYAARRAAEAERNLAMGREFVANDAQLPGAIPLPSGAHYRVIASGPAGGLPPGPKTIVTVNFSARTLRGEIAYDSRAAGHPSAFRYADGFPVWRECLPLMRPGDRWQIVAPGPLAYGYNGYQPHVGPQEAIVFDLELVGYVPAGR